MKTATVIGGSGFIGSHVADCLSSAGYQVTIYDKTTSTWLSGNQSMILGDVSQLDMLVSACEKADVVYNFAAVSDLDEASSQPLETGIVNVVGNINVLEACRLGDVKRYVYASSVYVFSRKGGFYRCSKQAAETYIEEYQRRYGVDYTILRYGSLYGPRSDHHNGLRQIVRRAVESGMIRYEGSSDAMREYIHVQDAARASVTILQDQYINQHLVLAGQESMKVRDMLEMLAEILDISRPVEFIATGLGEGHYVRTPYAYQPRTGRRYVMPLHVDLGQGLLDLISEVKSRIQEE